MTTTLRNWLAKGATPGASMLIRVDEGLSVLNHRLYSQAANYRVRLNLFPTSVGDWNALRVYTLPHTWYHRRAYHEMHHKWQMATMKALQKFGRKPDMGKWHDFRIEFATTANKPEFAVVRSYLSGPAPFGLTAGDWPLASAVHGDVASAHPGLYEYSSVFDDTGNQWELCMLGDTDAVAHQYGALYELDRSVETKVEATVSDADSDDMPYAELEPEDDTEVTAQMQHLETIGRKPPYDAQQLEPLLQYRGTIHDDSFISYPRASTGWFDAPLGFVLVEPDNGAATAVNLCEVEVAGGDYKGVAISEPFGGA